MSISIRIVLSLVVALAVGSVDAPACAQEAPVSPLTRVQQLLSALGGTDGYKQSLNSEVQSELRTITTQPGLSVVAKMKLVTRSDGALRVERSVQGQTHRYGTDTHNYWQQEKDGNVSQLSQADIAVLRLDYVRQQLPLRYKELGYDVVVTDGDTPGLIFRRKGTSEESRTPGDRFVFTLDPKTHLPAQITYDSQDPFGGKSVETTIQLADYRLISRIPIAHEATFLRNGKATHIATVTSASIGLTLADAVFLAPQPKPVPPKEQVPPKKQPPKGTPTTAPKKQ